MKTIFKIKRKKDKYNIKLTNHAIKRMKQRKISERNVIDNILSLSKSELKDLSSNRSQAIILDKDLGISVVIGFNSKTELAVITVIRQKKISTKETTVEFVI